MLDSIVSNWNSFNATNCVIERERDRPLFIASRETKQSKFVIDVSDWSVQSGRRPSSSIMT